MPDEKKEQEPITVVDRRRFTTGGERRPGVETSSEPEPLRKSAPTAGSTKAPAAQAEAEASRTARQAYEAGRGARPQKVDFETVVLSLSTSAMFQLGLVEDPARGAIPADLDAARHTIDMLAVIQEKTGGNLTAREQQLLEQVLYELRLAYLSVSGGPKSAAPPVG